MSNTNTEVTNNEKQYKGFYHDIQKSNRLLKVTLHANSHVDEESPSGWKYNANNEYDKDPLVVSIVKDDFQVGVANNWGEFSMGETIAGAFNAAKPAAPYLKEVSRLFGEMTTQGRNAQEDGALTGMAADFVLDIWEKVKPFADAGEEYLSRALVSQGTRFSYYSGTGVAFGNLGMKFTVFADWKIDPKNKNNDKLTFLTVNDQLEQLYPYFIGTYKGLDAEKELKTTDKFTNTMLNEFFGWQLPPGGFKATVKNVDTVQQGTLMLKIGSYYCIENLVVKDVQLNFSKHMVKFPSLNDSVLVSPLYCDVDLSLTPVCKYTDIKLKEFVSGRRMNDDIVETANEMSRNLENEKERLNNLSNKYYV